MAYTTIDDPSAHFQIKLYSGNSTNNTAITNDGNSDLQPDWIWAKSRTNTHYHDLRDSTRGVTKRLVSNEADTESTKDQSYVSFDSDGFTLGDDTDSGGSALNTINTSSNNYVAWQWKANGGTTSSNSSGSITSTVQANTTAGFSIVTYTGNGSQGATIGHGLGATPNVVLVKGRSIGDSWTMLHTGIASDFQTDMLKLDEDVAVTDSNVFWNDTAPTSSVFTVDGAGGETKVNANTYTYVAYCFTEIQGYSKFGSYTGNGNADGPFVYTGFKPAWIMLKRTDSANNWHINDSVRDIDNPVIEYLYADTTAGDDNLSGGGGLDFLSNGFKIRSTTAAVVNADGGTYIYIAFAKHPFVSSEGVPVTAR